MNDLAKPVNIFGISTQINVILINIQYFVYIRTTKREEKVVPLKQVYSNYGKAYQHIYYTRV